LSANFPEIRHYPEIFLSTLYKNTGFFTRFSDLNSTEAEFGGICPPAELLPMSYFYTYLLNPLNALLPILLGLPQPEQQ
jgi:hypothetical protein